MSIFHRLPTTVRKGLTTEPGERVLTFTEGPDGHVVATSLALYLGDGTRVPWQRIDKATWDEEGLLVVTTDGARLSAKVNEPRMLPEAVRERVNASIVVNKYVRLPGRGGVRMVARRVPGSDEFGWTVLFDEEEDAADPGARAQAEQALQALRLSMGI